MTTPSLNTVRKGHLHRAATLARREQADPGSVIRQDVLRFHYADLVDTLIAVLPYLNPDDLSPLKPRRKVCPECGWSFLPHSGRIYCSGICKQSADHERQRASNE